LPAGASGSIRSRPQAHPALLVPQSTTAPSSQLSPTSLPTSCDQVIDQPIFAASPSKPGDPRKCTISVSNELLQSTCRFRYPAGWVVVRVPLFLSGRPLCLLFVGEERHACFLGLRSKC
jgi:hypothetical protein